MSGPYPENSVLPRGVCCESPSHVRQKDAVVGLGADVLRQMAKREPMMLVPQKLELTTQQAAALLNVSRPFVIREIEAGRLKCRLINRHRRIEFEELMRYKEAQKQQSAGALKRLNDLSQELGEEL